MKFIKEIFLDRGQDLQVEEEEKFNFLISILSELQIDLSLLNNKSSFKELSPSDKFVFRKLLQKHELKLEELSPREFDLYHLQVINNQIIPRLLASWRIPDLELKKQNQELYNIMKLNCWSLLENNE